MAQLAGRRRSGAIITGLVLAASVVPTVPSPAGAETPDPSAASDYLTSPPTSITPLDREFRSQPRVDLNRRRQPGDKLGVQPAGMPITATVTIGRVDPLARIELSDLGVRNPLTVGQEISVQATPEQLRELIENDVASVVAPDYAPRELGTTSEGVGLIGATEWHDAGHKGEGVKVAIIDTGFLGYPSLIGSELPGGLFIKSFLPGGGMGTSNHGTAVAEVVYELAPRAELHLVAIDTESDMAGAVDYVLSAGIDVVNTSLGWSQGPFDGSSPVAQQVDRAVAAGVTWVTAAGNEAMQHWGGDYVDADGDDFPEFDPGIEVNYFEVAPGGLIFADLNWQNRSADLDICLVEPTSTGPEIIDCSFILQNPGDRPLDSMVWFNPYSSVAVFGVAVIRWTGSPGRMDLFVDGHVSSLAVHRAWRSLATPADVYGAITVGAVPWTTPDVIAPYSSYGPNALGQNKPDFVAPTGISGVTYGASGFAGTSAASPHVAGVAALLLEQQPNSTPAEVKETLAARAIPLGVGTPNHVYGWGLIQAGPAPPPPVPPGPCPLAADCDEVLVVDTESQLHLYDEVSAAATVDSFWYGLPTDMPLMGDWDCDGVATPGMYRESTGFVYLRNSNTTGFSDLEFFFGNPGDIPVVGDWNGDGCDTLAVFRGGHVFVANSLGTVVADFDFWFGDPQDRPFAGDFDADGIDGLGLYRESSGFVYFRNELSTGIADFQFFYGSPSDQILAGDWDGNGTDTVAVYRPEDRRIYFRMSNTQGVADYGLEVGPGIVDALAVRS